MVKSDQTAYMTMAVLVLLVTLLASHCQSTTLLTLPNTTSTLTLSNTTAAAATAPNFLPYSCIYERAVDLKIWQLVRQYQIDNKTQMIEAHNVTAVKCTNLCSQHAFMFFLSKNRSDHANCICLFRTDFQEISDTNIRLQIVPSDITNVPECPFPLPSDCKEAQCSHGYLLSCQITETKNWCHHLDTQLNSSNYDGGNFTYGMHQINFPQCLRPSDLNPSALVHQSGKSGPYQCIDACTREGQPFLYFILQGKNCWCAKENIVNQEKGFYHNYDDCDQCETSEGENEYATCGSVGPTKPTTLNLMHNIYDLFRRVSLYCLSDKCKQPFNPSVPEKSKLVKFAYFGCVKKPVQAKTIELPINQLFKNALECLTHCQDHELAYMKPIPGQNQKNLTCICNDITDMAEAQDGPKITDISSNCTETWSPPINGPSGSRSYDVGGYALYCRNDVCNNIADQTNFYKNSPGIYLPVPAPPKTTTPAATTAATPTVTPQTTATITSPTGTTAQFTTEIAATTTTLVPACCESRTDARAMTWPRTCEQDNWLQNLTTHCPDSAPGFALWKCDPTTSPPRFTPQQVTTPQSTFTPG